MRSTTRIFAVPVCVWAFVCAPAGADDAVSFNRDIRPLLSDRCFACHGPDQQKRKSGLRLDTKEGAFGKARSGDYAIVPGNPDKSALVERITAAEPSEIMPPPGKGKGKKH